MRCTKRGKGLLTVILEETVNDSFGDGESKEQGEENQTKHTHNGNPSSHSGSAVEGFVMCCGCYSKEDGEATGQIHIRGSCFYK